MIGHLGPRVSALLDGQLGSAESERAWAHVHGCPMCRDQVEREALLKQQLAMLGQTTQAPATLKGVLAQDIVGLAPDWSDGEAPARGPIPWLLVGSGAVGAMILGAAVLVVPWSGLVDVPPPVTEITQPAHGPSTSSPSDGGGVAPVNAGDGARTDGSGEVLPAVGGSWQDVRAGHHFARTQRHTLK
ncbi:MAG: hypothetical protein WAW88_13785 [Nocardioides sp.]